MSRVAAIQMCSSQDVNHNLETAAKLIQQAAENGAQLIVLPEMFAFVGMDVTTATQVTEVFGHGKIQDFLATQAHKHKTWIVGGTIPIKSDHSKARAACIVYDASGKSVARYDKIHLFDVKLSDAESYQESAHIEAGKQLTVVDTPVGKLGLAVCYDIRFPGLFTHLFNQGAEIFAIPAAFTVKTGEAHWQLLARSRAVENFCYVIGACQGGVHATGRETYGHSLIIDPWGVVQQERVDAGNGIIYAEIDLAHLYRIRAAIPIAAHQRIFPDISTLK